MPGQYQFFKNFNITIAFGVTSAKVSFLGCKIQCTDLKT